MANYNLSGTATLQGQNTISIAFSPGSIQCAPPPPVSYLNSAAVADGVYGYQIKLAASGLPIGDHYIIYWTINIDGVAAVNNDSYEFDATALTASVQC